jgi:hypothetical protein
VGQEFVSLLKFLSSEALGGFARSSYKNRSHGSEVGERVGLHFNT